MKVHISSSDPSVLACEFPIVDRLPNWFFRVLERSAGAYQAEGIDLWGRRVTSQGNDPDQAMDKCVAMARAILRVSS
jgi:hypothetical protein